LKEHTLYRGQLAELVYSDDPVACRETLYKMWVDDPTACENGLAALVIYKPTLLRLLGLYSQCTESNLNCYVLDDTLFFRLKTSGRIYNKVLGRKAFIVMPFSTPYLAVEAFYHDRFTTVGAALPGVLYATVDQASLEDARDPRKKHKKVAAGGSLVLEACGRENTSDIPRCIRLAEVQLKYRGRSRLALQHSDLVLRVLGRVRALLEERRDGEAKRLARGLLKLLGVSPRGKTASELVAQLERLHQPHRVILFEWTVNVSDGLPHELRDNFHEALHTLLSAASVKIGGKNYIVGFSPGSIEFSLENEHVSIAPTPPPKHAQWETVPKDGKLVRPEKLKIARVLQARRPVRRVKVYAEAQKRLVPTRPPPMFFQISRYEFIVAGEAEVELINNTHASEAYYRVFLAHSPAGAWSIVLK